MNSDMQDRVSIFLTSDLQLMTVLSTKTTALVVCSDCLKRPMFRFSSRAGSSLISCNNAENIPLLPIINKFFMYGLFKSHN